MLLVELNELLIEAYKVNASDLHITANAIPAIRCKLYA